MVAFTNPSPSCNELVPLPKVPSTEWTSSTGYAGGVLSPCSPGEKSFQASALFPVLHILKSIIDSTNILFLAPPPGVIPVTYTNAQYRQHYERAQENSVVSSSQRLIHPLPDFYDGECLFPAPLTASAAADAVPLGTDYVMAACQRMLTVCAQGAIITSFGETPRLPAKKRKASPPTSPNFASHR